MNTEMKYITIYEYPASIIANPVLECYILQGCTESTGHCMCIWANPYGESISRSRFTGRLRTSHAEMNR